MGTLILIIIALVLAANGDYTFFWFFGVLIALALICSFFGGDDGKTSVWREKPRTRVFIPGYYSQDYYRCSICGSGFPSNTMTCPHCGVRFNNTKTDDRIFIAEEEFDDWMDEMDEEDEEGR